jgi:hypothetical protein
MSNKPFTYVTIGKLEVLMLMLLLYIMLFDASMSNKPFTYVTIGKLEVLMLMLLLYIMLFDASIRCRDQRRQDNRNSVDDG